MTPILIIVIAIVAIVVAFVIAASRQPAQFRVQRQATMSAAPSAPFAQVNNFRNWEAWSPWAKIDPNVKMTYEGPATGVGSVQRWEGNKRVGAGSATITVVEPDRLIRLRLEFLKPWKSTNTAEFTFEPQDGGEQTLVTWTMTGEAHLMCRVFGMLFDMDKMVGKDFEKGLNQMKQIVEGTTTPAPATSAGVPALN